MASAAHVIGEQFSQCLRDGEAGEHFRRVIRSRLLPVTAGESEDEAAPAVWRTGFIFTAHLIDLTHEVIGVDVICPVVGTTQLPLLESPFGATSIEVSLCKEAGVGHQPFIDSAELIDAEFSIRDEAAGLLRRFLAQEQLLQHLLECGIAQTYLIDVRGSLPREQIRLERMEDQASHSSARLHQTIGRLGDPKIIVTGLDLCEQDVEGLIQVRAVATGGDVDERKVAQTVKAVSGFVFRRAGGNNVKLRETPRRRGGRECGRGISVIALRVPGPHRQAADQVLHGGVE